MQYLVVTERGPTSFSAYVPDLPGVYCRRVSLSAGHANIKR